MGKKGLSRNRKDPFNEPSDAVSFLCAFFIGAAMALVWGALSSLLHLDSRLSNEVSKRLFSHPVSMQIALYGIAGPVLEELLFRLFLFDLVKKAVPDGRIAAVIVSALFALWHGNVIQMLYAFPAGLILQALRAGKGRMHEPVLCHIGANLTAIAVEAFR